MDRGARHRLGVALIVAAIALGVDLATAARGIGAVFRNAWIERQGEIFTIHIRTVGRPRWVVNTQANRLQIDLLDTKSNLPARQFLRAQIGPLGEVTVSDAAGGRLRVQIDASGKCDYVVGRKDGQLIVRLGRAGTNRDLAGIFALPRQPKPARLRRPMRVAKAAPPGEIAPPAPRRIRESSPAPVTQVNAAAAEAALTPQFAKGHPLVVVDPGHGGHDPGTHSADGLLEKDLALQIARRLADDLRRRGVNAVMTRDRDVFLSLAQRTAIANELSADLFVSIHLNWSPDAATSGIEVYYLNNTTDRATIRLARMENAADGGRAPLDSGLNYILSDLRQQYKATESALLARVMEQQTVSELRTDFGPEIHGLGARKGPFYVLVGPNIPAVLVECGFLSNAQEAQRLASPAYQQALADGLATAVVRYLDQDVSAGTL